MKKVFLLFAALSLGMSAFSATYIIKDGKLQNGVVCGTQDWKDGKDLVTASTLTENAGGYMTYNRADNAVGCRLDLDPSVFNLHLTGLNIVFEYELPHSAMIYSEELAGNEGVSTELKDKPVFTIVCASEVGNDFKFRYFVDAKANGSAAQSVHICRIPVDGKFNPDAEKGFVKYEGYTFPKTDEKVNSIYITYMRELARNLNDNIEPAKIKNLYFYAPSDFQPFYGESFDYPNIWDEAPSVFTSNIETEDDMTDLTPVFNDAPKCYQSGNQYFKVYNYDDTGLNEFDERNVFSLKTMMLYENLETNWTGSDGSGILTSELFHGLLIEKAAKTNAIPKNAYVALENIELPENYEGDQLQVACIAKAVPKYYNYPLADNDLPIYYKFDNQEDTLKLFGDSLLQMLYTREVNTLTIPSGAKSISIIFKQNPKAGYYVDNLTLAVNWTTSVADVNGEDKTLSVYPNPVQNEIAFSGIEDVKTVEIVSLNGAVEAFPIVDGKVNVAKLAAGEYVIVVNKTISGKFIKK